MAYKLSNAGLTGADSHDSRQSTLDRKFKRGVRDNVLGECTIQVVRLAAMVVLARALGAAQFGLLRVLMVVALLGITTLQPGLLAALVQRREIDARHESTAWCVSVALGLAGTGLLYVGAPLIARLMAMPALVTGVRLICPAVFLDCLAVTSRAALERDLRYGTLAVADVIAEVGFLGTALGLLWTSMAQWSLMGGLAVRYAMRALVVLIAAPRLPRTWPRLAALRDLRRFAATVWGGSLVNLISSNADFILIGRLLGASALGFYMLAWDLLRFIPDRLYKVAGRVTFPAFCMLQDNDAEMARVYRNFFQYIARIVLPVAACAAVAAPELIGTVYGARWLPAAQSLRLLTAGLALIGLRTGIGSVYYAKARPSLDIYLHGTRLILVAAAVFGLYHEGLVGISAGMSGVECLVSVLGLTFAIRLIGLRWSDLLKAAWPGLRLALMCATATAGGKALVMYLAISGPAVLAFIALPPAAVFCCLEGSTLAAMVTGAFKLNQVAST